jgi:hypothetical protein
MRFRAASVSKVLMKTNHSNNRSLKQNSNRLAAYLAAGIGAGLVATPAADAAIVTIDITSTGFGLDGVNAGISPGGSTFRSNFPVSGGGTLGGYNLAIGKGIFGHTFLYFASGSGDATPVNFTLNQSIDSSANWTTADAKSFFKLYSLESPDFGSGSYMGFKTAQGNYGWLEVTWAGATDTFQIYSGAYESTAGVAILAGDTGGGTSAVPEPGQVASSLLLLTLGAAGVAIQRQRAKKKQAEEVAQS